MRVKVLLLFISLCCTCIIQAQRNCGSMEHLEHMLQEDPKMEQKMKSIERATQQFISNPVKAVNGIITIPVVVHVVYNTSSENISTSQINSQLTVLTEDFRRLNSDANNNWPQADDSEIEFCLATVDPNGNATSGITRTSTSVTSFGTNDNVKFNSSGGKDAWPAADYLNIWVCDLSGGLLGYAQFPGGPPSTDGVVCDYQYFGTNGTATPPFNLGRTATHEVGHWLNLRHIWGDGNCNFDDFVSDTPDSDAPNYGCATGHVSCGSTDMVENYMDYSDDVCMNLYTSGQKTRMRSLFDTGGARESLLNSGGCGAGNPPTCSDGIQNGNETGIDCGGPDCPPCNSSCTDTEVTLTIVLDNYPEETSWTIENSSGQVIHSGGTYGNLPDGSTVTETFCLVDGCYDFTIFDSYGDGICCSYGNGSYQLVDDANNVLASGGSFGSSESTNFCLSSGPTCDDGIQNGNETGVDCGGPDCPPCNSGCSDTEVTMTIVLDNYPGETTWTLENSSGQVVHSGGPYSSLPAGATVIETFCLADGCYDYSIFDSYGDGICCSYGNGSYELVDDSNNVLASGGSFGSSETTNFCLGGSGGPTCTDGIQNGNETGVDCGGPDCPPCNTGCTYQVIENNNFDSGWGLWNDGGSDCRRSSNDAAYANTGSFCVRLRDNTSSSVMTTDNLNLVSYSEVTIDFNFIAVSMENGEDFWLQVSTNGGSSYQTLISWARGTDFANNVREFESVVITGTFSANTRFRFRCDASANNDRIYIDDVHMSGCTTGGSKQNGQESISAIAETGHQPVLNSVKLYPNPARDMVKMEVEMHDAEELAYSILSLDGKLVSQYTKVLQAGKQTINVDVNSLESGIYYMYIYTKDERLVRKFSVLD